MAAQRQHQIINASAAQLRFSPTLETNEAVESRRKAGKRVIQLSFGESTFPIQADMLATHERSSSSSNYLPVAGLAELREARTEPATAAAVAEFHSTRLGVDISAEQVVVAPGSKPLLFALFDILEGDVLLPRPSWVSYEPQVKHARKRLFWVETDEHDRHTIARATLEETYQAAVAAGADPRVMLINSPSNPTGRAYSAETVSEIVSFCARRDIILISDEIYADMCFFAWDPQMSAFKQAKGDAQVILAGGLSKAYSVGGWRIGYLVLPDSETGRVIRKTLLAYASECWSTASGPAQKAAVVALGRSPAMEEYREASASLHRFVTLRLYEALRSFGLDVAEPQGGFYVYPSFNPFAAQLRRLGVHTSMDLSRWLIDKWSIATLPGSAHGEDDNGVVGGRLRLKMATSCLYFADEKERFRDGYELLARSRKGETLSLPLLDEAIEALGAAVENIRSTPA